MPRCKNVIFGATGTMSFTYIRMGCGMRDTALWLEVSGDVFPLLEVAQQNTALFIHTCSRKWAILRARIGIKIT